MISKGSRYRDVLPFTAETGREPFRGTRARELLSLEPILEHSLQQWDRPDRLAAHYYNDVERWWLLGDANPQSLLVYGPTLPDGAQPTAGDPRLSALISAEKLAAGSDEGDNPDPSIVLIARQPQK